MAYKVPVQQGPSFVDDVLKNVDTLPQTLRNVYGQIRDLDVQLKQIEEDANESLGRAAEGATLADHEVAQEELRKSADVVHANCAELADKKVALAQNASDIIATVIRGIDDKLLRFENQLRKEGRWPADAPPTKVPKTVARTLATPEVKANAPKKANVLVHPPQTMRSSGTGLADDNIVDPNEPRYCSCRQVSFGEMIACENAECPYEWFHVQCVGLTQIPSGTWRCPDCRRLRH